MSRKLHSGQIVGLSGVPVEVEIDLIRGLYRFTIVGLPDKAVEEAKERVSSAIKNSGFRPPQKINHRITVNLAPAELQKEGAIFDFAIALGYLLESKQISFDPCGKFFAGELALDGSLRPIKGALALIDFAKRRNFKEIFLPSGNEQEAKLVSGVNVFPSSNLLDAVEHLEGKVLIARADYSPPPDEESSYLYDFSDIKGQEAAKRAVEVAASGNHHAAFIGPPGTGKTLIARAIPSILPPLSFEDALEITSIHGIAGSQKDSALLSKRPFRSPHHTTSYVALVGGGSFPKPGEITLAHRGVLFLDEFAEFERRVIESLRQPLEDRVVFISRARGSMTFPADIMLVAAMNPCPCGNRGSSKACICSHVQYSAYERKISGPILDRIDIWIQMPQVDYKKLEDDVVLESSSNIKKRVSAARNIQTKRFSGSKIKTNGEMGVRDLKKYCRLGKEEKEILEDASRSLDLSARAYHRVIKVARTIADLAGSEKIKKEHVLEALQYRPISFS